MKRLFTPLGTDWKKAWYPYKWREEVGLEYSYKDPTVIEIDLDRSFKVGEYFLVIKKEFRAAKYNKSHPYVSGDITCPSFASLLDKARLLYQTEVGEPNEQLIPYLTKKRILKCMRLFRSKGLLDEIQYNYLKELRYTEDGKELREFIDYPIYRVDGTLRVVSWAKSRINQGIPLKEINYCQYHGDQYPGESRIKELKLLRSKTRYTWYREELVRATTLSRTTSQRTS